MVTVYQPTGSGHRVSKEITNYGGFWQPIAYDSPTTEKWNFSVTISSAEQFFHHIDGAAGVEGETVCFNLPGICIRNRRPAHNYLHLIP
jgi:hypothetical protein